MKRTLSLSKHSHLSSKILKTLRVLMMWGRSGSSKVQQDVGKHGDEETENANWYGRARGWDQTWKATNFQKDWSWLD